jgi:hypothetical protein
VRAAWFAAVCVPAVLAASAIAHVTAGGAGAGPTVVAVGDRPATIATGFSVADGRVVTVAHVLERAAITVRGADGVARRGSVVLRDDELDLALLDVPGLPAAPARLGAGTRLLVRRDGRIAALPARVVRRIDARVRTAGSGRVAHRPALELAARAAAGDSGAPVVVGSRVAGVVFARSDGRAGVAYAVDAAVLERLGE